ncbi:testis-specific H1 histone [Ochotona princeps]|uniref:testis-specific H1 histone n=1 Tax=Ochotona princeps TaxID=9978 RepID=UPI002714FB9E|nr:testis-specific H1 histone [Ochotona princeps]XP_058511902.1 testis-specific H1 histone [Ochotona princeps]
MAEAAEPSGESQGAEVKSPQPEERALGGSSRRSPRSVLKVSQLLLRAIAAHKGLTLAALKRELGNAGYEVRRKNRRHSGEVSRPEVKGTLLRVSGSEAAGYFRVWKIPKPKRKPGRPRLEEAGRLPPRRAPTGSRSIRRRHTNRKAAKKARAVWRQSTKVNGRTRRMRPKAKENVRARKMDEGRGRASKEDTRLGSREETRSSVRQNEEKDKKKAVKCTSQKPSPLKTDRVSGGQGKASTKASLKCDGPRQVVGSP